MIKVPFVDLKRQHRPLAGALMAQFKTLLRDTDFILGGVVAKFEEEFAAFLGGGFAVGVASGTDALHLALRALRIGPGDEVLVPTMTFAATALAVAYAGAKPVLVDVEDDTGLLDLSAAEAAITPRTRAVIPVHLYGRPMDMTHVMNFAARSRLAVVEDACQAHGARWNKRRIGTFGQAGCFSFYPAKNLGACGDGGMVVTQDHALADQLMRLRNYGQRVKYYHDELGYNSRLDTIQAAFLRLKLKRLDRWNALRRQHADAYRKALQNVPVRLPSPDSGPSQSIYHLYTIRTNRRQDLQAHLTRQGISTGIHYPIPIHLLGAFAQLGYKRGQFPIAEKVADESLSLPMFPELTSRERSYVAQSIKSFFGAS